MDRRRERSQPASDATHRGQASASPSSLRQADRRAGMITLSDDDLRAILTEACLAPSVHNIQPTRWRLGSGTLDLLGDTRRAIPVADPVGRDWYLSHGAALEGLSLALGRRGLAIAEVKRANANAPPSASIA